MSVEDTDFSPPTTAVMFLLTIHPTALEAGDFLSTGVKIQNPPAVPQNLVELTAAALHFS